MKSLWIGALGAAGLAFGAGWISAQSQHAPRHAGAAEFAAEARKALPEAPSHHFATGAFGSVFVVTPTKPIPPHYHAEHDETVVLLRGSGKMRLGGKDIEVRAHDLIFVPKGTVHDFRPGQGEVLAVSCFSPTFDGKDRVLVDPPFREGR
jgi:quercetin dioxygenase-like cupin family protein